MTEDIEKWAWDEACQIFHDTANNHHVWGSIATAPEDWQYNLKLGYANAIIEARKEAYLDAAGIVKRMLVYADTTSRADEVIYEVIRSKAFAERNEE